MDAQLAVKPCALVLGKQRIYIGVSSPKIWHNHWPLPKTKFQKAIVCISAGVQRYIFI